MKTLSLILYTLFLGTSVSFADASFIDDIPFKKSLTLTSVLLFDKPYSNTELVGDLANEIATYATLESKAIVRIAPLRETRAAFKQAVSATTFKNEADLKEVMAQLEKITDKTTVQSIEELQRDHLLTFNNSNEQVVGSKKFNAISQSARSYHQELLKWREDPLFNQVEALRAELRKKMHAFLKLHYSTREELVAAFNAPIAKVNDYLKQIRLKNG